MTPQRLEQFFSLVGDFFRGNHYPAQSVKSIRDDVLKEPETAFNRTLDRLYVEYLPTRQPAIKVIAEMIHQEGRKVREAEAIKREAEWNREKGADSRGRVAGPTFLSEDQRGEYAKRASKVIRIMISDASAAQKTEALEMMALAYPQSEYPKLHREFATQGYLNEVRG